MVASLEYGLRPLRLRWKVLANATRNLLRLQEALTVTVGNVQRVAELGVQDSQQSRRVLAAVKSDVFWKRTKAFTLCLWPLATLSSWLRGCSCHEADRLRSHRVSCPWTGCRAPEFAVRLREQMRIC